MGEGKLANFEEQLGNQARELSRGLEGPLDMWADSQVVFIKVAAFDFAALAIHLFRKITGDLSQQGE